MYTAVIFEDDISLVLNYEIALHKLNVKLLGVHKTWENAVNNLRINRPDFLIVDLFLSKNQNGFDLIKEIEDMDIPTIIITGYLADEVIEQALKHNVKAFLNKPVSKSTLEFTIRKLLKDLDQKNISKEHILIKDKGKYIKVSHSSILRIDIEGNYCYLTQVSGKRYVLKSSLLKFQEKLDSDRFFRCHRNTVLNYDQVSQLDIKRNVVVLINGEEIPVGNRYRTSTRQFFKKGG